jgi:hypothetical protein
MEGGTHLCKAFVSFKDFESFLVFKSESFKKKGFDKVTNADQYAEVWYKKWNGYGARTKPNPKNLSLAQVDENAKALARAAWNKNSQYV